MEITSWQSGQKALPTEKLIQALWSSKNDEELPNHLAQVGKATLKKKKIDKWTDLLYNLNFHRDVLFL